MPRRPSRPATRSWREIVVAAGRELGIAVAWLIGALNVHRVVLVGSVAGFGEPWLAAVRDEATRGALPLLSRDTTIEIGNLHDDAVVLGASALLMTQELGLSLAGLAAGRHAVDGTAVAGSATTRRRRPGRSGRRGPRSDAVTTRATPLRTRPARRSWPAWTWAARRSRSSSSPPTARRSPARSGR